MSQNLVGGLQPTGGGGAILGALRGPCGRRGEVVGGSGTHGLRLPGAGRRGEIRGQAPIAHRVHQSWVDGEAVAFQHPGVGGDGDVFAYRFN